MEKNVVKRFSPFLGGLDRDLKGLHDLSLPDILGKLTRSQVEIIPGIRLDPFFLTLIP
jgi:hypothetical protein